MTVVALASVKGSPGVTTAALAMAARWPAGRKVLLVEADPFGGDLAPRYGATVTGGLASLFVGGPARAHPRGGVGPRPRAPRWPGCSLRTCRGPTGRRQRERMAGHRQGPGRARRRCRRRRRPTASPVRRRSRRHPGRSRRPGRAVRVDAGGDRPPPETPFPASSPSGAAASCSLSPPARSGTRPTTSPARSRWTSVRPCPTTERPRAHWPTSAA